MVKTDDDTEPRESTVTTVELDDGLPGSSPVPWRPPRGQYRSNPPRPRMPREVIVNPPVFDLPSDDEVEQIFSLPLETVAPEKRGAAPVPLPGYHLVDIPRGELGTSGKIREELAELMDAEEQGVRVMQLCELADIVGAVEAYLVRNFPDLSIQDLMAMARVTRRAFASGRRR